MNEDGAPHAELNYKVYNGLKVLDVFFEANRVYYIPVDFASTIDSWARSFSVRVRQLTFVGHSAPYDTENGIDMAIDIDRVRTYCNQMNILFNHKTNMTVAQAKASLSDFNADIFVYSGHGASGYACYEKSVLGMFSDGDLPDMSNCELVIWDCCDSASTLFGDSLASQSIENGARTVIAWDTSVNGENSRIYLAVLFNQLSRGATVYDASTEAKIAVMEAEKNDLEAALWAVDHTHVLGDQQNIVFPIESSNTASISNTELFDNTVSYTWDRTQYTLIAQNSSTGERLYCRMINGIPTDDYFVEFYDEQDNIKGIYKSPYIVSESDIEEAYAQSNEIFSQDTVTNNEEGVSYKYRFRYIDGKLYLIEFETTPNCCDEDQAISAAIEENAQ